MPAITIVNLKCEGCANTIAKALEKRGFTNVHVDLAKGGVTFTGDRVRAARVLSKLGYPEAGSEEANSLLKKAASFVSCAHGRIGR